MQLNRTFVWLVIAQCYKLKIEWLDVSWGGKRKITSSTMRWDHAAMHCGTRRDSCIHPHTKSLQMLKCSIYTTHTAQRLAKMFVLISAPVRFWPSGLVAGQPRLINLQWCTHKGYINSMFLLCRNSTIKQRPNFLCVGYMPELVAKRLVAVKGSHGNSNEKESALEDRGNTQRQPQPPTNQNQQH